MEFKDKKVLVFGTGISGIGACELLEQKGAEVILYDGNEQVREEAVREKLPGTSRAQIVIGSMSDELIDGLQLAVLSPGVPCDLPDVQRMREKGIPIWGEVELAYQNGKGSVLAVTGTNGKTTTTSLLGEIMERYQKSVFVVGNIGNPYTEASQRMTDESVTVAEISSFQLETISEFHPRVSAILNITPDHLNRHHTMEEYIRVKESITKNQTPEDTCVLNYEDKVLREFAGTLKAKVIFFSSLRKMDRGLYLEGNDIVYSDGMQVYKLGKTTELQIVGRHNYENVMAASAMAIAYGVPLEKIRETLVQFRAVEHRIEFVTEKNGVVYYNDSKGTNPDAAIKGIQAMDRPTLLIGGGYDKGSDYREWIQAFEGRVKYLVLLGETKEKIARTARSCGFDRIIMTNSLEEAVQVCADNAECGDAVLLSPACASWDMFKSYEVRGRRFKELVKAL